MLNMLLFVEKVKKLNLACLSQYFYLVFLYKYLNFLKIEEAN